MPAVIPSIPTIGEIARRLGEPTHRIEYIIRARGILPCGRAGNARVFDEAAVKAIGAALQQVDASKVRDHEFYDS